MIWSEWLIFFFTVQIVHGLGTFNLYKKAGHNPLYSFIPIYNGLILLKFIKKPWWWLILLFIPIVNLFIFPAIWTEILRSFGKSKKTDALLVIATLGLYIYLINFDKNSKFINEEKLKPKPAFGEFISSLVYAITLATIVHTYFIQPFIIPTGSLEKSLLVGDFLFVSKYHYGARVPNTVVSFPMVHDTIIGTGIKSYLNKPQLPYLRFPKIQSIKRNEIVTFNWPADTVRQFFVREKGVKKPLDKKSNYVKRAVAIPGDTLEIKNGLVYINGGLSELPYRAKPLYRYKAYSNDGISARELIKLKINNFQRRFIINNINQNSFNEIRPYLLQIIDNDPSNFTVITGSNGIPRDVIVNNRLSVKEVNQKEKNLSLTTSDYDKLKNSNSVDSIKRVYKNSKSYNVSYFPNDITFDWNEDNFGPIIIPKKGNKVELSLANLPLYKRIIREYEKNLLDVDNNTILINEVPTSSYEFKLDYYWMMGDNRYNSEDSRVWGFVPEDHIVGKPVFIWMSIEGINDGFKNWKIRWDRVFTTVHGEGEPRSYLIHFLIVSLLIWLINKFLIRKKFG
jgi:signal peptidase I